MAMTTTATVACGISAAVLAAMGVEAQATPEAPWLQGGAVAALLSFFWLWRKDARDRENKVADVLLAHDKRVAELTEKHREDMKTILKENITVMRDVAEAVKTCPRKEKP